MIIPIASDHAGFEAKQMSKLILEEMGITTVDYGTHSQDSVDYPDYAVQVSKLIEVIKVIDLGENSVVREHCLIKISSTEKTRQDILNFAEIHKAKILEANHKSIIAEVVGAPAKIDMFVELMKPFGIKEMSRTGVNALARKG